MGRPSKLVPDTVDKLLEGIRRGHPYSVAATMAGINRETMRLWMERGEKEEKGEYRDFFGKCMSAREEGIANLGDVLYDAAHREIEGDWRAAAHILACRSEDWVKKEKVDASVDHSGGVTVVFKHIPARPR